MNSRIIWGFLLAVPFLFLALQSLPFILLGFGVVHFIAQLEFSALSNGIALLQRCLHATLTTLVWLVVSLSMVQYLPGIYVALAVTAMLLAYSISAVFSYEQGRDYKRYIFLLITILLITLPMAFIPAIANWQADFPYLLLLIGASWGADTGAIFAGKLTGRTPLSPRLSPKKTVEGAIGGAMAAGLIWLSAGLIYPPASLWPVTAGQPAWILLIVLFLVGAGLSLFGMYGDLVFSMYKRSQQVKDYSAIIPGHGGVLDRFDSMLFVAPLLYVVCLAFA
jgi:phosphatidate cytidylyltransferase